MGPTGRAGSLATLPMKPWSVCGTRTGGCLSARGFGTVLDVRQCDEVQAHDGQLLEMFPLCWSPTRSRRAEKAPGGIRNSTQRADGYAIQPCERPGNLRPECSWSTGCVVIPTPRPIAHRVDWLMRLPRQHERCHDDTCDAKHYRRNGHADADAPVTRAERVIIS